RLLATFRLHAAPMCKSLPTEPSRRKKFDPIRPGVSVANRRRPQGTLGLIVDHPTKGRCILSCAHVLIHSAGTDRTIQQPGRPSGRAIADADTTVLDQDGDAAIGVLKGSLHSNPAQLGTDVVVKTVRMPDLGEILTKSGLTTGVTCGVVDGLGRYLLTGGGGPSASAGSLMASGMDGFRIVPRSAGSPGSDQISDSGDSGATWYAHADLAGVGLHVAGETDQNDPDEHAIACYLPRVLQRLGVTPAVTST
ncbi:MAG TPA: hypothetical protein VFQ76_07880, partial [Longimicrobiaceae bacterium]|nr:hypothetical protein [Longimicrobiaceae bacterium]